MSNYLFLTNPSLFLGASNDVLTANILTVSLFNDVLNIKTYLGGYSKYSLDFTINMENNQFSIYMGFFRGENKKYNNLHSTSPFFIKVVNYGHNEGISTFRGFTIDNFKLIIQR